MLFSPSVGRRESGGRGFVLNSQIRYKLAGRSAECCRVGAGNPVTVADLVALWRTRTLELGIWLRECSLSGTVGTRDTTIRLSGGLAASGTA